MSLEEVLEINTLLNDSLFFSGVETCSINKCHLKPGSVRVTMANCSLSVVITKSLMVMSFRSICDMVEPS